jgi:hypothetical protein
MIQFVATLTGDASNSAAVGGEGGGDVEQLISYLNSISDKIDTGAKEGLEAAALLVVKEIMGAIQQSGAVSSGQLLRSVTASAVQSSTDGFNVTAGSNLVYASFIENGRSAGKMPPVDSIMTWMASKGITPSPHIAYLIAQKIGEQGYVGKHPFETGIARAESKVTGIINEAVEKNVNR